MHGNLIRLVGGGLVLSAPVLTSAASRTRSSLENASWIESVILTSSDSSLSRDGVDDAVPEPLTASVVGAGYSLDGQVIFPQGGAPNVTVTLSAAEATFDPVIEVADMVIPGTSASYRDYFTVEFSPGYFALGQVPVERTTWGKIKRLYRN